MGTIDIKSTAPIEAIADRYMNRIPCPSVIDGFDRTYAVLRQMIEDHGIEGIIFVRLKFCDHFAGMRKLLADRLRKDNSIPVMELEREYATIKSGQLSTEYRRF